MGFEPKKGYPFSTIPITLGGTVAIGQAMEISATGIGTAATGANTGRAAIAANSGVSGDAISAYTEGVFVTTNTDAGAMEIGALAYLENAESIDTGTTNDVPIGFVVGPAGDNAVNATVWVKLQWGLPAL